MLDFNQQIKTESIGNGLNHSHGFFDWFCDDGLLQQKSKGLIEKASQIKDTSRFDSTKVFMYFENACPGEGELFDRLLIANLKNGKVLYSVTPASGHKIAAGRAQVWGRENKFNGPLVDGSWEDVIAFFQFQ